MIDAIAQEWRETLLSVVAPHRGSALLLSGGMDSRTLLAARAALGDIPDCFTFSIGGVETKELRSSMAAAASVGAPLTVVSLPLEVESLAADVKEVIAILGRSGKAAIQCAHPVLYMARAVAAAGHTKVMIGTGGICEDDRKCQMAARAGDWDYVAARREKQIDDSQDPKTATWAMWEMVYHVGLSGPEPYRTEPLRSLGLSIPFPEINSPRQKGIGLRAFPEFYAWIPWRLNSGLQVGSGVREYHDALLNSRFNTRGSLAVIGIYNDFAKEVLSS